MNKDYIFSFSCYPCKKSIFLCVKRTFQEKPFFHSGNQKHEKVRNSFYYLRQRNGRRKKSKTDAFTIKKSFIFSPSPRISFPPQFLSRCNLTTFFKKRRRKIWNKHSEQASPAAAVKWRGKLKGNQDQEFERRRKCGSKLDSNFAADAR